MTFSVLEEIMGAEDIWYTTNRSYDSAISLKSIAYNLVIMLNKEAGNMSREMIRIASP